MQEVHTSPIKVPSRHDYKGFLILSNDLHADHIVSSTLKQKSKLGELGFNEGQFLVLMLRRSWVPDRFYACGGDW